MVFSSPIFIFFFLPILFTLCLAASIICGKKSSTPHNILLFAASIIFYAWGEGYYILVLLTSILLNYIAGIALDYGGNQGRGRKIIISIAVILNLSLLASYKYANFVVDNINPALSYLGLDVIILAPVHLPIGISFFTFQAMSYIIDIYRRKAPAQRNIFYIALYISLFPQLIAGPIVRYSHVIEQLKSRVVGLDDIYVGVRRFIIGLAKKVLIADHLAIFVDQAYMMDSALISPYSAWIGAICFMLQLYFDFSGYSDMAIGIGRMFGIKFRENFRYPYMAKSMRKMPTLWHISLSSWLRDYLYKPLRGKSKNKFRAFAAILIVLVMCGLWHGASWHYVVCGLVVGGFIGLEIIVAYIFSYLTPLARGVGGGALQRSESQRAESGKIIAEDKKESCQPSTVNRQLYQKTPPPTPSAGGGGDSVAYVSDRGEKSKINLLWLKNTFLHIYSLLAACIASIFFRAETVEKAVSYIKSIFGFTSGFKDIYFDNVVLTVMLVGIIAATPIFIHVESRLKSWNKNIGLVIVDTYIILILMLSIVTIAASSYTPFIYFRF